MYSYEDRIRAVKFYINCGYNAAYTVRKLGYPDATNLKHWYREYSESNVLHQGRKKVSKYSDKEKRDAVDYYFSHDRNALKTVKTHAHEVFDRYVKMDRLPLTDAVCINEVFLDMDEYCKYALLIQDFHTGNPIDLLRSRRANVAEPYFVSLPPQERNGVKYLISDM